MLFVLRLRPGVHGTLHRASLLCIASAVNGDLRRGPERPVGWARRENPGGYAPRVGSPTTVSASTLPGGIRSGYVIDRPVGSDRIGLGGGHPATRVNAANASLAIPAPTSPDVSSTLSISLSCLRLLLVAPCRDCSGALSFRRLLVLHTRRADFENFEIVESATIPDIEVLGYIRNV